MDFVQDLLSQKRWDDDPVVTHQQAILDRNLR